MPYKWISLQLSSESLFALKKTSASDQNIDKIANSQLENHLLSHESLILNDVTKGLVTAPEAGWLH